MTSTKPQPGELHIHIRGPGLPLWTIYDSPREYPGLFVARRFLTSADGPVPDPDIIGTAPDLVGARALLPLGLTNLGRDPEDDPVIVETWI